MLISDNQQVTTIGWFIGILEGEGNFDTATKRIRITNTNSCLIQACEKFLQDHGIFFKTITDTKRTKGGKLVQRIYVSGSDCYSLYKILGSKLQCRNEEYRKIIEHNLVGSSETLREITVDLDWLTGIWQAEGCFGISRGMKQYILTCNVCSTSERISNKITTTLYANGLAYYVQLRKPTSKLPIWSIDICGIKRVQRFLEKMKNLWIGKRDQKRTSLVLEYIESRLSKPISAERSIREIEIFNQMRLLNS